MLMENFNLDVSLYLMWQHSDNNGDNNAISLRSLDRAAGLVGVAVQDGTVGPAGRRGTGAPLHR